MFLYNIIYIKMTDEYNNLQSAIKNQLKKDFPDMTEDLLNENSESIASAQINKEPVSEKLDEEGRIIISENTKFYIGADIQAVEE